MSTDAEKMISLEHDSTEVTKSLEKNEDIFSKVNPLSFDPSIFLSQDGNTETTLQQTNHILYENLRRDSNMYLF